MIPGPNTHTINTSSASKDFSAIRTAASAYFDPEIDGFDVVMEAVGIPVTFDMCQSLVGKGGTIANIGVHSVPVNLKIDQLWPRGTSKSLPSFSRSARWPASSVLTTTSFFPQTALSMALVSTHTIPRILDLLSVGKLETAALMVTHGKCRNN